MNTANIISNRRNRSKTQQSGPTHLQYDEIGGSSVQLLVDQTLMEEIFWLARGSEQVWPESNLGLASTLHDGLQVDRELMNKLHHTGQLGVRDRLLTGGFLLQYLR